MTLDLSLWRDENFEVLLALRDIKVRELALLYIINTGKVVRIYRRAL